MKQLLILLLLPVFACAQSAKPAAKKTNIVQKNTRKGFVINGSVNGLPDSTMVFLTHPAQPGNMFATGYAKNGKFTLEGQTPYADVYQLSFIGHSEQVGLYLENSVINITGDVKSLDKLKFSGSSFQSDYQLYEARFDGLKRRLNELAGTINKTQPGLQRDSMIGLFEMEKQKVIKAVDEFIKLKPASPVSAYVVYVTSPIAGDVVDLQNRYKKLFPSAVKGFYGEELKKITQPKPTPGAPGTMAIDFSQKDTSDRLVSLSSFKGKFVLVDFWASWCKPCRMENPAVVNAYNTFRNKNFTILSVSLDQSKENWLHAIKEDNLTWTHVSDLLYWNNAVAKLYEIGSIPSNMLIDPSGKIIARDLRGEALYATLKNLLK